MATMTTTTLDSSTSNMPAAPVAPVAPVAPASPDQGNGAPGQVDGAPAGQAEQTEAFVGRLFEATLGAIDLLAIYLGDQLGLYRALAGGGPATSTELAARTGTHERFVREWLEQQAVSDILEVGSLAVDSDEGGGADGAARRYRLPAARAEALLSEESLAYFAPLPRFLVATARQADALLQAYRTGSGVPYTAYGADAREAQAAFNRPAFANLLGSAWLPTIPDVHARLLAAPPARVADIGCGAGWSSIAIARAYPNVQVDGFDSDAASIELARRNAAAAGVGDRVSFQVRDAADPALAGTYDLVVAFETIHDMARPVGALRSMRRLAGERGAVLVMDERVGETFTAPGDPVERLFYGSSILFCLPTGMADGTPEQPSAGTGTVMRPAVVRRYATEAGFREVEILPIEHDMFRFYRLVA
jgi:SAM-dependent methyltransferase